MPATPTGTTEHIALVDGAELPIGVAIAAELMAEGADWAYSSEVFGARLVLLDHTASCVGVPDAVSLVASPLRAAHGRWGGFPDVVAAKGSTVIMREAKLSGRDKLNANQHNFARLARCILGDRLDLAVVEWGGGP
jgi:hypothetical protein